MHACVHSTECTQVQGLDCILIEECADIELIIAPRCYYRTEFHSMQRITLVVGNTYLQECRPGVIGRTTLGVTD